MDKEDVIYIYIYIYIYIHTHNGILLSHKKNSEIMPFVAVWMDLENIILSEISQTEKDSVYYLYVESKKYYK